MQKLAAYRQTLTTAVPGQIVATPMHEDMTPEPTEEAQEAQQAISVIAQATAAVTPSPSGIAAAGAGGGALRTQVWQGLGAALVGAARG